MVVQANVNGRDIGSYVEEARTKVDAIALAPGLTIPGAGNSKTSWPRHSASSCFSLFATSDQVDDGHDQAADHHHREGILDLGASSGGQRGRLLGAPCGQRLGFVDIFEIARRWLSPRPFEFRPRKIRRGLALDLVSPAQFLHLALQQLQPVAVLCDNRRWPPFVGSPPRGTRVSPVQPIFAAVELITAHSEP